MNPKSTDCEADVLTTTPPRRRADSDNERDSNLLVARRARARVPRSCRPRSVVLGRVQRSGAAKREREYVNFPNTRYWSSENLYVIHETSLHDLKIGVWCAVSGTKIVGPIFFESTVNTDVYLYILRQFNDQLTPQDKMQFFFQQDGATCHTSHRSLTRVHDMSTEKRTTSKGLWPTCSPDLSSLGGL